MSGFPLVRNGRSIVVAQSMRHALHGTGDGPAGARLRKGNRGMALATSARRCEVIWTIIGILVVLWLLGFITDVVGGLIHILLVLAVIALLFQLFTGRRVA